MEKQEAPSRPEAMIEVGGAYVDPSQVVAIRQPNAADVSDFPGQDIQSVLVCRGAFGLGGGSGYFNIMSTDSPKTAHKKLMGWHDTDRKHREHKEQEWERRQAQGAVPGSEATLNDLRGGPPQRAFQTAGQGSESQAQNPQSAEARGNPTTKAPTGSSNPIRDGSPDPGRQMAADSNVKPEGGARNK